MNPPEFSNDSLASMMEGDPMNDLNMLLSVASSDNNSTVNNDKEHGNGSPFGDDAALLSSPFSSHHSSSSESTSPSASSVDPSEVTSASQLLLPPALEAPTPVNPGVASALASLQQVQHNPTPAHMPKIRDTRRKASGPPLSQWTLRRALGDNLGRLEDMVESGVTLLNLGEMHAKMQDWNLITEKADGTLVEDSLRGRISKHTLRDALDESYGMLREIDHAYLPYLVRELQKRRKRSEHQQRINRQRRATAKAARATKA